VLDYALPIQEVVLYKLQSDVQEFGILLLFSISTNQVLIYDLDVNEDLPAETLNFCCTRLLVIGFDPENPPPIRPDDEAAPFGTVYLQLRDIISLHIELLVEPALGLSAHPIGALGWEPNMA
jgi:hypothetical protein